MQVDFLIVGQGICGTFFSWYLQQEGKSFIVIDNADKTTASRVAAGVINPVTGRRHVTVWLADELLPFARQAYHELGHKLGVTALFQKNIIDFFPSPQMRQSFLERIEEGHQYVHSYPEQNHFNHLFNYDFGCGEIRSVYIADIENILFAWRQYLQQERVLRQGEFDNNRLRIEEHQVSYDDINAKVIIFCDGNSSVSNPWFKQLPFAPNKGELLIAEIPDLPDHFIYKKGMMIVPLSKPGLFWIGSSYEWDFDNDKPSAAFRERTEKFLKDWLKIPFRVTDHLAAIRPATLERRPFVGLHPLHSNIGILNGMGTKGCSLAPFFAKQLCDHILHERPILPEADVKRFSRILTKA